MQLCLTSPLPKSLVLSIYSLLSGRGLHLLSLSTNHSSASSVSGYHLQIPHRLHLYYTSMSLLEPATCQPSLLYMSHDVANLHFYLHMRHGRIEPYPSYRPLGPIVVTQCRSPVYRVSIGSTNLTAYVCTVCMRPRFPQAHAMAVKGVARAAFYFRLCFPSRLPAASHVLCSAYVRYIPSRITQQLPNAFLTRFFPLSSFLPYLSSCDIHLCR
ncbi:hypothetical protein GGR51DRAFT_110408 [Nemania sp. FL0031]|nr:hypothetical protein GGR51DRAFT_110408 [Nemania sp. FL0031]